MIHPHVTVHLTEHEPEVRLSTLEIPASDRHTAFHSVTLAGVDFFLDDAHLRSIGRQLMEYVARVCPESPALGSPEPSTTGDAGCTCTHGDPLLAAIVASDPTLREQFGSEPATTGVVGAIADAAAKYAGVATGANPHVDRPMTAYGQEAARRAEDRAAYLDLWDQHRELHS